MTIEPIEPAMPVEASLVEPVTTPVRTEPVSTGGGGGAVPRRGILRRRNPIRAGRNGLDGIVAVGVKELRGRVRGRRAFVVLTFYLLFLGLFAWAWELVAEQRYAQSAQQAGSAGMDSPPIALDSTSRRGWLPMRMITC